MDKHTHILIAARFTASTWSGCGPALETLIKEAGEDATAVEFGVFVFRPRGKAFWLLNDFCDYLRRADVPFVRIEFSTPLSGFLSDKAQAALANIGVEFWNKDA